jgi:hypothetical protein
MDEHVSIFLQRTFLIQLGDEQMNRGETLSGYRARKEITHDTVQRKAV